MNALVIHGQYRADPVEEGYRWACMADRGLVGCVSHLALRQFGRVSRMSYAEFVAEWMTPRYDPTEDYSAAYYMAEIMGEPIPVCRPREPAFHHTVVVSARRVGKTAAERRAAERRAVYFDDVDRFRAAPLGEPYTPKSEDE